MVKHAVDFNPQTLGIHQIFINFDGKSIADYPTFVKSHNAFRNMPGCSYRLWNYVDILQLLSEHYPRLMYYFCNLQYRIQQVDLTKYMIANTYAPCVVCDLDVFPMQHVRAIPGIRANWPFVFDRCSRQNIVANDFFFVRDSYSLGNLFEYFMSNLQRVDGIEVYKKRKMRYVFHTTGPDFWTRFIKQRGWRLYVDSLSTRVFADSKQKRRNVYIDNAYLLIEHQLSWCPQLHCRSCAHSTSIPWMALPDDDKNCVEQESKSPHD